MIPAKISQSLTCRVGEALALPGRTEICCVILLCLPVYSFIWRERLWLHNREQDKTEALSCNCYWERMGLVWHLFIQAGRGTDFLGKVCIPHAGKSCSQAPAGSLHGAVPAEEPERVLCNFSRRRNKHWGLLPPRWSCYPATRAPETALHFHKDTDLEEQLSPVQNLHIFVAQCFPIVLRDLCFSHVWFMRFSSYTLLRKALKHIWKI